MRNFQHEQEQRKPLPVMSDLVELCPTLKEAKKKHGGQKSRGKIIKAVTKGK